MRRAPEERMKTSAEVGEILPSVGDSPPANVGQVRRPVKIAFGEEPWGVEPARVSQFVELRIVGQYIVRLIILQYWAESADEG